MNKQEHINYWLESSENDWLSCLEIVAKNDRKHMALFLGHLSLEKQLKAIYVKLFDQTPPFNHDLVLLAEKVNLSLDDEIVTKLKMINEFNIQTRYPEYKNDFYKRCTNEFVTEEISKIEKLRKWIENILENML